MSVNDPRQKTSSTAAGRPESGLLGILRGAALVAVVAGAVGSEVLMLRAGRSSPRLLLVLFTIWVLSPFVGLLWANLVSRRWSVVTRVTLYCVTFVVALGSLAIYSELIVPKPQGAANAFLWVVVPPASWLLMLIVVPLAALVWRRLSRRGAAA